MSNGDLMEEVMYKAHNEGIVNEVQHTAKELRDREGKDFYESYIQAYNEISSTEKKKES